MMECTGNAPTHVHWHIRADQTHISCAHTPPSSHDWSTRVRVSAVTVWVEGCRNSASYFAFSLIPAAPSRELLTALHSMMPNANSLPILSRMRS